MKKIKDDQNKKFSNIYNEYFKKLLRFSLFYVSDKETATDIVQETFAKAWKYIFLGGVIKNMKAFLYKTLKNNIVNYYRSKKTVSLDSLIEKEHFNPSDKNIEVTMEEHADSLIAFEHLSEIPKKDKKVVMLHFVRGLNFKKIASMTKQSENTVVVQFHRAIKKLRNLFYHDKQN